MPTNDVFAITTSIGKFALKLYNAQSRTVPDVEWEIELTRAHSLFTSSQEGQKNKLLKFMFANLTLEDEKLGWELKKPFNSIFECGVRQEWLTQFKAVCMLQTAAFSC